MMKRVMKVKAELGQLVGFATGGIDLSKETIQEIYKNVFEQLDRFEDMLLAGARKKQALIEKYTAPEPK